MTVRVISRVAGSFHYSLERLGEVDQNGVTGSKETSISSPQLEIDDYRDD